MMARVLRRNRMRRALALTLTLGVAAALAMATAVDEMEVGMESLPVAEAPAQSEGELHVLPVKRYLQVATPTAPPAGNGNSNNNNINNNNNNQGGSGSDSPTPSPKRTAYRMTLTPPPVNPIAERLNESSFLGLFKTEKIYTLFSLSVPAAFLVYKIVLYLYFRCHGYRKQDEERHRPPLPEDQSTVDGNDDDRGISGPHAANGPPKDHQTRGLAASLSPKSAAKAERTLNKNGMHSKFWIDEELQAWRLDFQQLKMTKCLTTTPNQRRHAARGAGVSASEVWLATYYAMDAENNQRMVALKWIPPRLNNTEAQQDKLKEEVRRQAKLRHPNVATFIGIAWSADTNLVAVTEYMARGDLRQWLHRTSAKEAGKWTAGKVQMLLDIANALVYLHSFQPRLVHGNCNSRNVLINDKMQAKLSDFGAPKDHISEREIMAYKEVGSGRWISPEALMGSGDQVSDAMDVYSLGILMVEMDTHELPFADLMQADRTQLPENDVLQLIANGALTPTLSPTCHPRIDKLVQACTAFNPQKRPSSRDIAGVLAHILRELEAQQPGHAAPQGPVERSSYRQSAADRWDGGRV
ncbi:hypothetical protein P43SY_003853 [Pythium insidiosum]|uniref:Protein kinase domain-containing protein n=1 Tax=Pythium insidiosum TaxID=114742 RepID=A0AAD5Q6D1_PYTIN|nr:hypothetical protein P43SY_003853 [Pythium insidiosum]